MNIQPIYRLDCEQQQDEIAIKTAEFLSSGKKINQIPMGHGVGYQSKLSKEAQEKNAKKSNKKHQGS